MSSQPSLVTELCDVTLVSVSAGSYHSAAVDSNGSLWTWGWGVHGQLGLGNIEDEYLPRRVLDRDMIRDVVVQAEAGYAHTIALTGSFLHLSRQWGSEYQTVVCCYKPNYKRYYVSTVGACNPNSGYRMPSQRLKG